MQVLYFLVNIVAVLITVVLFAVPCSFLYMTLPLFRRVINRKPFSKRRARKIALWNSVLIALYLLFFSVTQYYNYFPLSDGIIIAGYAIPFYFLNIRLLRKEKKRKH